MELREGEVCMLEMERMNEKNKYIKVCEWEKSNEITWSLADVLVLRICFSPPASLGDRKKGCIN